MHLDQLRYIVDLEKTKSISASAERLYVTQQAISQSIKKLEHELNAVILLRDKTGVTFTEAGKEVLLFAEKVLNDENELHDRLQELRMQDSIVENRQNLRISSASSVLNLVLPQIISKSYFKKKRYNVNIAVIDNVKTMLNQLVNNEIDIGFISINEKNFMDVYRVFSDVLKLEILMRDELVAVMDRRYYNGKDYTHTVNKQYTDGPVTLYNIVPMDLQLYEANVVCSTDADFHRSMMEHTGAMAYMSRMAYQYFFNSRKYVQLSLSDVEAPLIHAIVYREHEATFVQELADAIRLELYKKI